MSDAEPPDPVSDWLCPRPRRVLGPPAPSWEAWLRSITTRLAPLPHSTKTRFFDIVCLIIRIAEKVFAPPPTFPGLYNDPQFTSDIDCSAQNVLILHEKVASAAFTELKEVLYLIRQHVTGALALLPHERMYASVTDTAISSSLYATRSDISSESYVECDGFGSGIDVPPMGDIIAERGFMASDVIDIGLTVKDLEHIHLRLNESSASESNQQYIVPRDEADDDASDGFAWIPVETVELSDKDNASLSTDSSSIVIDDAASVESAELSPTGNITQLRDQAMTVAASSQEMKNAAASVGKVVPRPNIYAAELSQKRLSNSTSLHELALDNGEHCSRDASYHHERSILPTDWAHRYAEASPREDFDESGPVKRSRDFEDTRQMVQRDLLQSARVGAEDATVIDETSRTLYSVLPSTLSSDAFVRIESDLPPSPTEAHLSSRPAVVHSESSRTDDTFTKALLTTLPEESDDGLHLGLNLNGDRTGTAITAKPAMALERVISSRYGTQTNGLSRRLSVVHQGLSAGPSMKRSGSSKLNSLAASPSFDRLITSEHFVRTASVGFLARNESSKSSHNRPPSPAGPVNPAAALRVTFISVNSYGNTELSYDGAEEQGLPAGGGLLGAAYGPFPSFNNRPSFRSSANSSQRIGFASSASPSPVEEAAGSLYRGGSIDERWRFAHPVGVGAFSEVWLGEGRKSGGRVAIKIIKKGAQDLFGKGGVCREVLAFQTIGKHPNIVECIEVCEDECYIYVVLELLTGGLLLARIADAEQYYPRYDEKDAAHVVRCMVKALAFCHAVGVAHRDVKPENLLFVCEGMDNNIKLTDFGIAHFCDTPCTEKSGTPLYVAPEVLLHKPYGCAADMWSVGVIAHIILCGYPPFDDDDIVQLIRKVKYKPVRLRGPEWRATSNHAQNFVSKLLVREPEERMTAAQALEHPWMLMTAKDSNDERNGWPLLRAAQLNIRDFVVNREFKRVVQHENAESARNLAMLVSMSEKDLAPEDEERADLFATSSEDAKSISAHGGRESTSSTGGSDLQEGSLARLRPQEHKRISRRKPDEVEAERAETDKYIRDTNDGEEYHFDAESREQAELRRRRLLLQESLRRQRLENRESRASEQQFNVLVQAREGSGVGGTSDGSNFHRPSALDTSPDLSLYATGISGSYEERRFADADEDWERLRGRAEKDMRKFNGRHERQRKLRLRRRPPLFGGSNTAKTKAEAKNALLLS